MKTMTAADFANDITAKARKAFPGLRWFEQEDCAGALGEAWANGHHFTMVVEHMGGMAWRVRLMGGDRDYFSTLGEPNEALAEMRRHLLLLVAFVEAPETR